jgi:cellulose biosynthesis protein BcsQ
VIDMDPQSSDTSRVMRDGDKRQPTLLERDEAIADLRQSKQADTQPQDVDRWLADGGAEGNLVRIAGW